MTGVAVSEAEAEGTTVLETDSEGTTVLEAETAGAAEEGTAVSEELAVEVTVSCGVGAIVVVPSVGESVGVSEAPGGTSDAILVVALSTTDRSKPKRKSLHAGFRVIVIALVAFLSCLRDITNLPATAQTGMGNNNLQKGELSPLLVFQRSSRSHETKMVEVVES